MLEALDFGTDRQSVEAPRFQTRYLASSFDNHGMAPGELTIDERTGQAFMHDLARCGHQLWMRTRFGGGAALVISRVLPKRVIEAGAGPCGCRAARAW